MLEDMLVKWAVEGKRRSRRREVLRPPHVDNSSICTASSGATSSDPRSQPGNPEDSQPAAASTARKAPPPGTIGKILNAMEGLGSEEKAIMLRDERLLASGNPDSRRLSLSMPPTPSAMRIKVPTPALTVENMALLSLQFEVNPFDLLAFEQANDNRSDSDGSTNQASTPEESRFFPLAPLSQLARNPSSQDTVVVMDEESSPPK